MANSKLTGLTEATSLATTDEIYAVAGGNSRRVSVENLLKTDLAALASSIAKTAVDVFVYDTSLDSDGGAWRKRTQHTSWYNETLDTNTRGSRKEFPAVAVIVMTNVQLTIYDGDDPSLPMWMMFENLGSLSWASGSAVIYSSVSALNGKIIPTSTTGAVIYDFPSDDTRLANVAAYKLTSNRALVGRNGATSFASGGDGYALVNSVVNDVAMTVLPNAPIDPATGLPVPTIAVATNGGVSVINNDGTVADSSTTLGLATCGFTQSGLIFGRNTAGYLLYYSTHADYQSGDGHGDPIGQDTAGAQDIDILTRLHHLAIPSGDRFVYGGNGSDSGTATNGLWTHTMNPSDFTKGMSTFTTADYATGYMVGDIKLATLSDTTAGTVTAPSSVVSPTFIGSEWDIQTASWSIGSGVASCTGTDSVAYLAGNNVTTGFVSGDTVKITFTVSSYTSGTVSISLSTGVATSGNYTATGTYTYYGKMSGNNSFYFRSDSFVGTISSPVITKLEQPDRSVNDNPLEVFGTITKTAVETGADLVAYSDFSASNYLEQPYNSDLDFGTGDFSVMGWVKLTGAALQFLVYRGTASASSFDIYADGSYNLLFRTPTKTLTVSSFTTVNTWAFCTCVRRNGVGYIYRNGELIGSNTDFGDSVTLADAYTRIGYRYDYPATYGNMALWRISATAPTAEQIAKIYNDEKFLFQENAKATLDGASDAVTALAHDPITGILHAGTSEGRSDFAGLRRVNNTTTAVGVSISAVDGLIVED
jgi:trimeric autotransporter adhesin